MSHMLSFIQAQVELHISSEELIKLLYSGEIAGKYRWTQGWQISQGDVRAYARDMAQEQERWTRRKNNSE